MLWHSSLWSGASCLLFCLWHESRSWLDSTCGKLNWLKPLINLSSTEKQGGHNCKIKMLTGTAGARKGWIIPKKSKCKTISRFPMVTRIHPTGSFFHFKYLACYLKWFTCKHTNMLSTNVSPELQVYSPVLWKRWSAKLCSSCVNQQKQLLQGLVGENQKGNEASFREH